MTLPKIIEVRPLTSAVTAAISVPGSKSITNRALVLAALGRADLFRTHEVPRVRGVLDTLTEF